MKKSTTYCFWLLAPIALWAQAASDENSGIDLSEITVVEDNATSPSANTSAAEVVEIPEAAIEGVRRGESETGIPSDVQALPDETEIVLELPRQEAVAPSEASLSSNETISVDFPDEDVRTILRNIADLFELNLVIPDTLQGRTSLKLRNITWQQAFQVVLEPLGFTYVEDRNIIMIKSIEELTTEPVDTRVFVVSYARADELRGSIEPLIDAGAGGRIQVDTRSNALVITERPSRMGKIQEIIERLDQATDQVMIESKFIEVTRNNIKNIGVNWASLQNYEVSTGPFDESSVEVDSEESENSLNISQSQGSVNSQLATVTNNFSNLVTDTTTTNTAVFSADQFSLVLSALKTANDVELVANPTVVTLDNTKATIDIAEFFPNPRFTFNAETGQRQLNGVDLEEDGIKVGITLEVTPQVNSLGFINLDVNPTVSRSDRTATIEGSEFPIIDKRTTQTKVTIKDGYTLAIGGLVENSVTSRVDKVPLLGNLPGVGRLFKSESDDQSQRNLIIFITAKMLDPDGTTYEEVIDPRVLDELNLSERDMPGFEVPEEEANRLRELRNLRREAEEAERLIGLEERIRVVEEDREAAEKRESQSEAAEAEGVRRSSRFFNR
jgi:type IV pilus assembly protein PilQ